MQTKIEKLKKKYNQYIGCPTSIQSTTGFLVIWSKGKVLRISRGGNNLVGMFIGIHQDQLAVTFGGAFVDAVFNPKFVKII